MTCELSQTRLHAYVDNELDAMGAAEFERHLETCPDCKTQLGASKKLRNALSQTQLYERAPASLHGKIRNSLPKLPAVSPSSSSTSSTPWQWLALAAALLLAAVLGWRQWNGANPLVYEQTLAAAAVDAHLRSMQPGHLADVVSTDQHTVKPWFDGRLTFAPPVRDFADAGFPLIGGRLDVIDGRTVAALVYGRRKHIVNVFVAKAEPSAAWSGSGGIQGYHWTAWQKDGLSFCAVSDAAAADLEQLKQLFLAP
jgi:anti-sigma factor (TIGR02949 family)